MTRILIVFLLADIAATTQQQLAVTRSPKAAAA